MNIDTIFIPCAGKGTRMGELGKILPKPLWPLFESTLLSFQIEYFKRLGFKKIIINTHHLHKQFEKYKNKLEIVFEPELLGSGGSLHNIKKRFPHLKKICISNPDIVFNLSQKQWRLFIETAGRCDVENVLIGLPCTAGESYNELVIQDNLFKRVQKAPRRGYITYSGIGIVDLNSFPYVEGESSFFSTVINSVLNKTIVMNFGQRDSYWDFGSLNLYTENILKIIETKESSFRDLLTSFNVVESTKEYLRKNVIQFGPVEIYLNENMTFNEIRFEGVGYSL